MLSRECLILSQRQTSEALASSRSRLPHGQTGEDEGQRSALPRATIRSARLGSSATPRPWSPTDDFRLPDQRLVFQSRSDRWAVLALRHGYFVRRRKSQGLPTHGSYVLLACCLRGPVLRAPASQPASPVAATWLPTLRPQEAEVGCWHGSETSGCTESPGPSRPPSHHRARRHGRCVPSFPEEDPSSFLLIISAGHLFVAHCNDPGPE